MKNLINKIKAFFADEQGAETVEWVMIAATLAAIIAGVFWGTLQTAVSSAITTISGYITNPSGATGG